MLHLGAQSVPYSDWGSDAEKGWYQTFFYDQDGSAIKVRQIIDTAWV